MIRLLLIILTSAVLAAADDATPIATGTERGLMLHREHDSKSFNMLDAAQSAIDFQNIDHVLLDAAVFHETNRRRIQEGLPALSYLPELREAAMLQSEGMRKQKAIAHVHPDKSLRTLGDRFEAVGLKPKFRAENVAMVFGVKYESGEPFYIRTEEGKRVLSATPGGPPIPEHTYLSFARSLLDNWMNSPGHRKNILHKAPQSLGVSCLREDTESGPDRFFCSQEFFAPFPE